MNVSMTTPNAANWQQPQVRNYAPPERSNQPADGYVRGEKRPLADTVSRYTAVGLTTVAVAALAGASEGTLAVLGLPVAAGSIAAVVLSFVGKQNGIAALRQSGSKTDMAARIAAFSAVAASLASMAGGGDVVTGVLALPLLVAAPAATAMWAIEKFKGGSTKQQEQAPVQPQAQQWAPPAPVQFGSGQPAPAQFGAQPGPAQMGDQPPAAPVQFGSGVAQSSQQQGAEGPPPAPTFSQKPYWQQ